MRTKIKFEITFFKDNKDFAFFMRNCLPTAHRKYTDFCRGIETGELSFETCENFMHISSTDLTMGKKQRSKRDAKNWEANFEVMMKSAGLSQELIKQRMRQLDLYLKLSHISEIVQVLIEIKTSNQIQTDFSFLEDIKDSVSVDLELVSPMFEEKNKKRTKNLLIFIIVVVVFKKVENKTYKKTQIKDIDEKSMKMYEKLQEMSKEDFIICLKKYSENYSFVEWLRQNTRGNYIFLNLKKKRLDNFI